MSNNPGDLLLDIDLSEHTCNLHTCQCPIIQPSLSFECPQSPIQHLGLIRDPMLINFSGRVHPVYETSIPEGRTHKLSVFLGVLGGIVYSNKILTHTKAEFRTPQKHPRKKSPNDEKTVRLNHFLRNAANVTPRAHCRNGKRKEGLHHYHRGLNSWQNPCKH